MGLWPDLVILLSDTLPCCSIVWLEAWITNYFNGIALIVSHDRFFLEGVCTDILGTALISIDGMVFFVSIALIIHGMCVSRIAISISWTEIEFVDSFRDEL